MHPTRDAILDTLKLVMDRMDYIRNKGTVTPSDEDLLEAVDKLLLDRG